MTSKSRFCREAVIVSLAGGVMFYGLIYVGADIVSPLVWWQRGVIVFFYTMGAGTAVLGLGLKVFDLLEKRRKRE